MVQCKLLIANKINWSAISMLCLLCLQNKCINTSSPHNYYVHVISLCVCVCVCVASIDSNLSYSFGSVRLFLLYPPLGPVYVRVYRL